MAQIEVNRLNSNGRKLDSEKYKWSRKESTVKGVDRVECS